MEIRHYGSQKRWAGLSLEQRRVEWREQHQPFELKYHQQSNMRWDDEQFFSQWDLLFGDFMQFSKSQFISEDVLLDDIAGSTDSL